MATIAANVQEAMDDDNAADAVDASDATDSDAAGAACRCCHMPPMLHATDAACR